MKHLMKRNILRSLVAASTLLVTCGAGTFIATSAASANGPLATVPGAPTGLSAITGDSHIDLSWTAPDDGGSPITGYTVYESYNGTTSRVGSTPATSIGISGLVNGGAYQFTVDATNDVGTSSESAPYAATPSTIPDAPTLTSAVGGNESITANWDASTGDGGSPITGYTVFFFDRIGFTFTEQNVGADQRSYMASALINYHHYDVYVEAVNANGSSTTSNVSQVTPAPTAPGAPSGVVALPGDGQVGLSWVAPDNGGSPVTGYWVKYSTGGNPATTVAAGSGTHAIIGGLTNGESYQFQVEAGNNINTGPLSDVVSATPAGVPGAPTAVSVTGGSLSAIFSYDQPSDNGSPITSYVGRYTSNDGNTWSDPVTLIGGTVLSGLTRGTAYQFEIAAVNDVGQGPWSDMTSPPLSTFAAPSAPTGVTVAPGNQSALVGWSPSSDDGGSPITSYTAYAYPNKGATPLGSATPLIVPRPAGQCATDGAGTSCTITGLSTGLQYSFVVVAGNNYGASLESAAVVSGPYTVPGIPTDVSVATGAPGMAQINVSWTAPATSAGVAPVTGYQLSYRPHGGVGTWSVLNNVGPGTSLTLSGLNPLTSYDVYVQANSAVGYGDSSDIATGSTSAGPPTAPGNVKVTPGDSSLDVSWTASESQAPGSITYTAEAFTGVQLARLHGAGVRGAAGHAAGKCVTTSTSCTITGLTNGTKYSVIVVASNGGSAVSTTTTGTPAAASPTPSTTTPSTTTPSPSNNNIAAGGKNPVGAGSGEGELLIAAGALLLAAGGAAAWRRRTPRD